MKTPDERTRLKAVKEKFVLFPRKCKCCGDGFTFRKMFYVDRYGLNKTVHRWYYCKKCTPEKIDVVKQVDTDDYAFGIAHVDGYWTFHKRFKYL